LVELTFPSFGFGHNGGPFFKDTINNEENRVLDHYMAGGYNRFIIQCGASHTEDAYLEPV
jgi:hypothetical protein